MAVTMPAVVRTSRAHAVPSLSLRDRLAVAEPEVLDVEDGLVEQLRDVRVMQPVDHLLAAALPDHQPHVPQLTQLMRDRRCLHRDRLGEFVHRARPRLQPGQDPHPARGGQDLHLLRDGPRKLAVHPDRSRLALNAMSHRNI